MDYVPKISVIVPVHNSYDYIEKCLVSLLNQTLREIEVVTVLDCPTDGTERIVHSLAQKDERIKILRNDKNLHVGLCRNKGMEHATGKYIGFCDHDDYCDPDMYSQLYQKAEEENLDIAFCNYRIVYPDQVKDYIYPQADSIEKLRAERIEGIIRRRNFESGVIWNHIYKTEFIKQYHLIFVDTNIMSAEDRLFYLNSYYHAKRINGINQFLYYHRIHDHNTGKSEQYLSLSKIVTFFKNMEFFLIDNNIESTYKSCLYEGIVRRLYTSFASNIKLNYLGKMVSEFKRIKHNKLIKESLDYFYNIKNMKELLKSKPSIISFLAFMKMI